MGKLDHAKGISLTVPQEATRSLEESTKSQTYQAEDI